MPQIPEDDVLDVMEMTQSIEEHVLKTLNDNDMDLAMSALISSFINCLVSPCKSLEELIYYRNFVIKVLDNHIKYIKSTLQKPS